MVINHLLDGMILQVTRCFFWRGHWSFPSPVSASGLLDGQVVQVTEDDCHEGDGYHLPGLGGFSLGGSSLFCKWLINMVIVSPLRIGLFPFQMGEIYGL